MPLSNEEEEVRLCYSSGCTNPGDFSNEYTDEFYCEAHNEMVIDHYYESEDDSDNDDDNDNDERTIHSYGFHPRPSFMRSDGTHSAYVTYLDSSMPGNVRSNGRTTFTMGFELETQYVGDESFSRDIPIELLNDVNSSHESDIYLKEDGSVYNGFEIVSHPGELDYFMNHFKWKGIENLARKGFQAWKRPCCGLHVHVSKSSSSRLYTRTDQKWFNLLVVKVTTTQVMTSSVSSTATETGWVTTEKSSDTQTS